jgi:hypothetical protein
MVLVRDSPNADYSRQVSGGNSPGLSLTSTPGNSPEDGRSRSCHPVPHQGDIAAARASCAERLGEPSGSPADASRYARSEDQDEDFPYFYQPDPAIRISDNIGTIEVRLREKERADWVPEVIQNYGVFVVGTGQTKDARCGRFKPLNDDTAGACPNKPDQHKPFLLPIGCSRRECPEDFTRWTHKAARRLTNIVNGYLNAKYKNQSELMPGYVPRYLPDHISIHPPRSLVVELVRRTKKALEKKGILDSDYHAPAEFHRIFQKKYQYEEEKAIKILGLSSAVSFYHPVRLRSDAADREADQMNDSSRYRKVLDQKHWIKGVKFSVHSHIVTDGSYLMNSDEFYEVSGGWTYRNHREISDIENLAKYLLSHAAANPGKHSLRYLGEYQKMNVEGTIKVETFIPCPECLAEDIPECEASYVVGKILEIEYEKDRNGHNQISRWEWGEIYGKHYIRRARIIPVFRLRPFGQRRIPVERLHGKPLTMPYDAWSKLPADLRASCQWIEHYSQDEWSNVENKPQWWI